MPAPIGISASRGSGILGVNKYKTPLVSWLEIMEIRQPGFCAANNFWLPERGNEWEDPRDPKMAAIRWGHAFEDAICELTGGITDREKFYTDTSQKFPMTCHLDGLKNGRVQENKTVFETAFKMGWGEPKSDMVPEAYQVQVQHQMYLAGLDWADVNALVFPRPPAEWEKMGYRVDMDNTITQPGGQKWTCGSWARGLKAMGYFHHFHVQSNIKLQAAMIERYRAFWNDNVLKEVPPPVQGYDDIKWMIRAPEGEIEATDEMKELWSERNDILDEIEDMSKRADECKDNFARMVQDEILKKNVKPGNEKRKLNIMAGSRKLGSVTKGYPGLHVNAPMVKSLAEDDPEMYEVMKKTSFADIMPDEIELTDGQKEKIEAADQGMESMYADFRERMIKRITTKRNALEKKEDAAGIKVCDQLIGIIEKESGLPKEMEARIKAGNIKLSKLLMKNSVMSCIQKNRPELFKKVFERGIVEESTPKSSLRMTRPEKE